MGAHDSAPQQPVAWATTRLLPRRERGIVNRPGSRPRDGSRAIADDRLPDQLRFHGAWQAMACRPIIKGQLALGRTAPRPPPIPPCPSTRAMDPRSGGMGRCGSSCSAGRGLVQRRGILVAARGAAAWRHPLEPLPRATSPTRRSSRTPTATSQRHRRQPVAREKAARDPTIIRQDASWHASRALARSGRASVRPQLARRSSAWG